MREGVYSGYIDEIDQYDGSIDLNGEPTNNMASIITTSPPTSPTPLITSSSPSLSPSLISSNEITEDPDLELVDLRSPEEIAAKNKSFYQRILEDKAVLKVVHLGIAFCLLFLGFDACQDLVTTFHEKDGAAGLAILYIVFGVSSFFAPMIVEVVGIRLSLFSASIGYVMFIVCVEPYLDTIFYPISAVEGFAAALLWTAQPVYLSKCATDQTVLGKFSGIFYAIFQTAIILGNLLSAALLSTSIKEEDLLYILAIISFFGSVILALLRRPETKAKVEVNDNNGISTKTVELDPVDAHGKAHASPPTSPELSFSPSVLATSTDEIIIPPVEKPRTFSLLVQTLKMSVSKKMLWLHPIFVHQGLSNAIFMGAFPLQMSEEKIGFVIATFGISDVIGSIFWGKVYDLKGWKILAVTAIFLGPASYFCSTLNSVGLWPLFLAAVGFGFLDALQNILIFSTISTNYIDEQDKMCAFAVSKFSNSVASGLSFFAIPYVSYGIIAFVASVNILLVSACIFCFYYYLNQTSFFNSLNALFVLNKAKFDLSILDPTTRFRRHAKMQEEL